MALKRSALECVHYCISIKHFLFSERGIQRGKGMGWYDGGLGWMGVDAGGVGVGVGWGGWVEYPYNTLTS